MTSNNRASLQEPTTAAPRRRWLMRSFALGLAFTACAASAQVCVAPPPGAIYWLAGERNFDDLAGFHNGHSGATDVGFVPGQVGDAMRFDGIDDAVTTDVSFAEMGAQRGAFSYELWARPLAVMPACAEGNFTCGHQNFPWAVAPVFGPEGVPGEDSAGIGIAIGSNAVCVGQHAHNVAGCLARLDIAIDDWTHIVAVIENKTPRIYLDGALAHTGIASEKDVVFASWRIIGSGTYLGHFAGDLDEVTIYNRALGGSEIAGLFAAGTAGKCRQACAIERTDDAWQGALVTAHTPLRSSGPNGMFGATVGSPEPTSTLFAEGLADGTVHAVEWQTPNAITLGSFGYYAFHSPNGDTLRSFRHLRLQARVIGGTFATIYESPIATPYGQGDGLRELFRCPCVRPVHAQQFRAEFVQHGAAGLFSGTRVSELDGLIHDPIFRDDFE